MTEIQINMWKSELTDFNDKTHTLLDCRDFFKNKSRYPMHSLESDGEAVCNLILASANNSAKLFSGFSSLENIRLTAFDSILCSYLVRSSKPFRIAEMGSTDGLVSYHMTQIAGALNKDSRIHYISNVVGNNSGNRCLDAVSAADYFPDMSFVYSDYEDTGLRDGYFDITVINGTAGFADHYGAITEAQRITAPDGIIICLTSEDYLLESTFRLIFSKREEYYLLPTDYIFVAVNGDGTWRRTDPYDISKVYGEIQRDAAAAMGTGDIALLRKIAARADEAAGKAAALYEHDFKQKLIDLKEQLITEIISL